MKELKADIQKIIVTTFAIGFSFILLFLYYYQRIGIKISSDIHNKINLIMPISFAIYLIFNYQLWKIIPELIRVQLGIPPNLNGRWEGYLNSTKDSEKIPFVIEIEQNFSCLTYKTYTGKSDNQFSGSSISATILSDESSNYKIVTTWYNSYVRELDQVSNERKEDYYGTSQWIISNYRNNMPGEITYPYFTDRSTQGKAFLKFVSRKLIKRFK